MTATLGSEWRLPIAKSFGSCPGVTFTAPVPNAGSTNASAMMGSSRPMTGSFTRVPTMCRYRSSSGFTATAVSPSIVSGRVVATVTPGPCPTAAYFT